MAKIVTVLFAPRGVAGLKGPRWLRNEDLHNVVSDGAQPVQMQLWSTLWSGREAYLRLRSLHLWKRVDVESSVRECATT